MEEIWRDVKDYEGIYQVSNKKRIKSIGNDKSKKEKIRKCFLSRKGYYLVRLYKKGEANGYELSRLVAFAFPEICGEYFEGAEVDHINTIRTDDRPENLRWVTPKMNTNNPLTLKHISESQKGRTHPEEVKNKIAEGNKNHPNKSKGVVQLSLDDVFISFYPSLNEAERQTGIGNGAIRLCCQGKTKKSGGYHWKYA